MQTAFDEFAERERQIAPGYSHIQSAGYYPMYMMERSGLMRYAGKTGRTRIVIEYDNDTGEGVRAVFTDAPIRTDRTDTENQNLHHADPIPNSW